MSLPFTLPIAAELQLEPDAIYELPGELDYTDLRDVADLSIPSLRFEPWTPVVPARLADEETDIFANVRAGAISLGDS